jgi:hypothetical protein
VSKGNLFKKQIFLDKLKKKVLFFFWAEEKIKENIKNFTKKFFANLAG